MSRSLLHLNWLGNKFQEYVHIMGYCEFNARGLHTAVQGLPRSDEKYSAYKEAEMLYTYISVMYGIVLLSTISTLILNDMQISLTHINNKHRGV